MRNRYSAVLKAKGKPFAVSYDADFEEKAVTYDKGDILILFTDGIQELKNSDGTEYEEERLCNVI
ncbi:MAG: SpoIIE family protein phosphatase, partial [Actinomycetia bacterium]|nr:SpoIIE family protein phosphatase [Actinomycetes bacterium]